MQRGLLVVSTAATWVAWEHIPDDGDTKKLAAPSGYRFAGRRFQRVHFLTYSIYKSWTAAESNES